MGYMAGIDLFFETMERLTPQVRPVTSRDRWYCDLFAYTPDGGRDDFDWLSNWQSEPFAEYTITGLEPLQAVYASKAFRDPANHDAAYLSSLLVVTRFQPFMQRAADRMSALRVPLYVTAHDFDFIARLVPGGSQGPA